MTPMASEKDSSVVLPQALGQVRPVWTLEVDPGQYIVVATVGDRNVGFAAHLEVGGQPLFCGEWIEAGSFKSRCVLCIASRGAITVGPSRVLWSRDRREEQTGGEASGAGDPMAIDVVTSPRGGSPLRGASPSRGSIAAMSPRAARSDALGKGTRLVSVRVAAVALVREVERERRSQFCDLNQKISEAKARLEGARQALYEAALEPRGACFLEREFGRSQAKLAELHVQKALKLFSLIAMCRRVTHPYIYLSGEVSAVSPVGPPQDPERYGLAPL